MLSFWNDNISYVLRGAILMELSFRGRIQTLKDPKIGNLEDRILKLINEERTGEVLLDETIRLFKKSSDTLVNWIDVLSGIIEITRRKLERV